jgi:hypothetical protein
VVVPFHWQPGWLEHVAAVNELHGVGVPLQALVEDHWHGW